jgi:hypothetical protein
MPKTTEIMWKYIVLILCPTSFNDTLFNEIEYYGVTSDTRIELVEFYTAANDTNCIIAVDSFYLND